MTENDSVRKSISPLINCMRPFGLYFTRKPRVSCETTTEQSDRPVRKCRDWNFPRIHATIILVVTWLNALRYSTVFDGKETLGAALFMKLGMIPAALLNVVFQTTYYIACHTGILDRVIHQAGLSMAELSPKYGCRTKVALVVCWLLFVWNMFHYTYQLFTNGRLNDLSLIILNRTLPESYLYVVRTVVIVLQLQTIGTWLFPQAMNYMVMTLLYDQFAKLNEDFSKCIGDRGEFSGNFEQFRRRHQVISRSVQEADRFLMLSNGANFCCTVASIILILYSAIFYRDDTISLDPESAVLYMAWLSFSLFALSLVAGQAIMLNDAVSVRYHDIVKYR